MDTNYFTAPSDNIVQNLPPTVLLKDIVKFKRGSKVIGSIDAKIDFSDLSPELHQSALQLLQRMPMTLMLASDEVPTPVESTYPPESKVRVNQWPHVWQQVKGWFRNG